MSDFRTILKQYLISVLLLTTLSASTVSGASLTPPNGCKSSQCSRFASWGFSTDIARHADDIHTLMITTKIETSVHTIESFMEAINSNWGEHITGTEYSEYRQQIVSAVAKLGMYTNYNELHEYSPNGLRLYIIILGSHPSQLCSVLAELTQMRHRVHNTFLIGSTVPVYESSDYLNCSALNAQQRQELRELAEENKFSSDQDIMSVYFNEPELNSVFFSPGSGKQKEYGAEFRSNSLMKTFLESNSPIKRMHSSVFIAAPQPYMPEAVSILRNQMRNAVIYRLSSISNFSIYESLNALRSWLQTDYSFNQ